MVLASLGREMPVTLSTTAIWKMLELETLKETVLVPVLMVRVGDTITLAILIV